jgi:hypothetical protein
MLLSLRNVAYLNEGERNVNVNVNVNVSTHT